jgi:hypothetical protein
MRWQLEPHSLTAVTSYVVIATVESAPNRFMIPKLYSSEVKVRAVTLWLLVACLTHESCSSKSSPHYAHFEICSPVGDKLVTVLKDGAEVCKEKA